MLLVLAMVFRGFCGSVANQSPKHAPTAGADDDSESGRFWVGRFWVGDSGSTGWVADDEEPDDLADPDKLILAAPMRSRR